MTCRCPPVPVLGDPSSLRLCPHHANSQHACPVTPRPMHSGLWPRWPGRSTAVTAGPPLWASPRPTPGSCGALGLALLFPFTPHPAGAPVVCGGLPWALSLVRPVTQGCTRLVVPSSPLAPVCFCVGRQGLGSSSHLIQHPRPPTPVPFPLGLGPERAVITARSSRVSAVEP